SPVGTLTATDTNGTVGWTFTVANSAVQHLAAGETLEQEFTVTVADNHGGSASEVVTVTIVGTNEDPVLSLSTDATSVTETTDETDTLSNGGSFTYTDVDTRDTHTVSVVNPASPVGTLTATDTNGTVGWTFTVANSAVQHLAAGETLEQEFTVTVADNHGGSASEVVTVTIVGTNEDPVLSLSTDATSVTETTDETDTLSNGGSFTYTDLDTSDTHTVSVVNPASPVGTLTATDTNGTVGWKFTVAVADNHGGSASEVVTVTIVGTNEDPVLSLSTDATSVTETTDETDTLSNGGSFTYTDLD